MARSAKDKGNKKFRGLFRVCVFTVAVACASMAAAAQGYDQAGVVSVGNARFTVITKNLIRMEFSKDRAFIDAPSYFAADRESRWTEFKTSGAGGSTVIDTGAIRLIYLPDGKPFSASNLRAEIKKGAGVVEWKPEMPNPGNLGGTIRTVDGVSGPVDLGEGVLSRDGWYLLDDSRRHLLTSDWVEMRPAGAGTDWYLFGYGYDYPAALKSLTAIGGDVPLPRKYSLGAWYSRYWPYTSSEYRDLVKEYDSHGFPLDVIVMDMDWHKDGWTGWSWNRKLLPDAEDLLKWFHEEGLAVTLNLHPADGIGPHEDMYADFMRAMGADPASKKTILFDAGDKKYLDTLFKYAVEPHEREGVDFWWLDWQQYQYTPSVPELTNLSWLNQYFTMHTSQDGRRGQSFSRWAGWGDHRHPIHFSGDAHTIFPMLAFEVPLTSTAGNVGCFFWSHDIGGHMGARIPESYTRWVQFGATSPALRSHSTRSADLDRRPWKYDKWAEDSMRISFHLRSEIFPYIYSSAWQSHRDSIPLVRPMYFSNPEIDKAYRSPQQYFFGDAFLAAPIVTPGIGPGLVARQTVWFPDSVWYNWFTGERFEGGSETVAVADINEFPLYAKGGLPIPMQPYTHRMATTPLSNLIVRAYPGKDGGSGKSQLYEDDGISSDYLKGKYAVTYLVYHREGNTVTVTVDPALGDYAGQLKERAVTVELPCTKKASGAKVGGAPVAVEYDAANSMNIIRVPAGPISKGVVVTVVAEDADFGALRDRAAARRLAGIGVTGATSFRAAAAKFDAATASPETLDMFLSIGGLAVIRKNEALYYFNPIERAYFFASPGAVDGDSFKLTVEERIGETTEVIYEKDVNVAAAAAAYDMPEVPPIQAAGAFGVQAVHVARLTFTIGGKPFSLEAVVDRKTSWLTKWNVIGQFPYNRGVKLEDQKFEPENAPIDLSGIYKGLGGSNVNWRRAKAEPDGTYDLQKHFYIEGDDRLAYGVTYIESDSEQPVTFTANSDDGIEMWLNGDRIHLKDVNRSMTVETDDVHAALKAGRNELLIKISQQNFRWGFRIGVEARRPIKESFGKK
jgi:alpha-glucosidase (family GH31 glycosyl hydrolase)